MRPYRIMKILYIALSRLPSAATSHNPAAARGNFHCPRLVCPKKKKKKETETTVCLRKTPLTPTPYSSFAPSSFRSSSPSHRPVSPPSLPHSSLRPSPGSRGTTRGARLALRREWGRVPTDDRLVLDYGGNASRVPRLDTVSSHETTTWARSKETLES